MRWTAEMDEIARGRWQRGDTGVEIAKLLGITSRNAVKCRALRQGWGRLQPDGTLVRHARKRVLKPRSSGPELATLAPLVPEPEPEPEPFRYGPVPLLSARPSQCRYFVTERPNWVVCGECTVNGSSWCAKHVRLCFNQGRHAA